MVERICSLQYGLSGVAYSRQGGRPENQDDFGFVDTPLGALLIVCDGMGGGPGGRVASSIAKNEIMRSIYESNPQAPREAVVKEAVARAQTALERKMSDVPELRGMGSTFVLALINKESAMIAHAGDSRAYRICGKHIAFRTIDHSLVAELVKNKVMSEEQARVSPQSNVITRGLGCMKNHVPDIQEVAYRRGDRFLLCSDGAWGIMPQDEFVQRITIMQELEPLINNLAYEVDQVGSAHGNTHDNHTIVAVEINMDSILKDKMSNKIKLVISVLGSVLMLSIILNVCLLNSNDTNPKQEEALRTAIAEIEKLKPYETRYNELVNGGTTAVHSMLQTLTIENDSLRMYIRALENQKDSIKHKTISKSSEKTERESQKEVQSSAKTKTPDAEPITVAQQIISSLKALENAQGKDIQKVRQQKNNSRVKLLSLISELNVKTNGSYEPVLSAVRRQLHENGVAMKIDKPDKEGIYRSTSSAKKEIARLKEKIGEIISKLR